MRVVGLRHYRFDEARQAGLIKLDADVRFIHARVNPPMRPGEHPHSYRAYCGGYHIGYMPDFAARLLCSANASASFTCRISAVDHFDKDSEVMVRFASPLRVAPASYALTRPQVSNCGVYAIVNVCDMRAYVGKTDNLERRRTQHLSDLKQGNHFKARLLAEWRRQPESFAFVVLQEEPSDLDACEGKYIYIYGTQVAACGYNYGEGRSRGRKSNRSGTHNRSSVTGVPPTTAAANIASGPAVCRTLRQVASFLAKRGFTLINHRSKGGGAWVFENAQVFQQVAFELEQAGVQVKFYSQGRKRHPTAHYEIDPRKLLPP